MNKFFLSFIAIGLCFVAYPTKAQQTNSDKFLDIQIVESKNGIKAWLVEDHAQPIIALQFAFRGAGAINNGVDEQGLSQLLSNTLDEGAGELTSQEFQKTLSDNSITLRFSSGRDNFGGNLVTLSRHKETAFNLLKLALTSPRFDEEPVERMRQANLSRIRNSQSDPDWIAARIYNDIAYQNHPYALNSGGTITSLQNITADDLQQFKEAHFAKENLIIGVSGDINAEELASTLDNIFGALPNTRKVADNVDKPIEIPLQNTGEVFVYDKDIPQSIIMMGANSIDENDPDYFVLQIMNYIYGGSGFGSLLMEEAREKRGLTYGIYSSLNNLDYQKSIRISTSTKNESTAEMLDIIRNQMRVIQDKDLTEPLKDAKSYLTGSLPLALTSTGGIADILLALQSNERPIDYLDTYQNKIDAVSEEDIKRLAEKLLEPEALVTVIVGNPATIENAQKINKVPNVE